MLRQQFLKRVKQPRLGTAASRVIHPEFSGLLGFWIASPVYVGAVELLSGKPALGIHPSRARPTPRKDGSYVLSQAGDAGTYAAAADSFGTITSATIAVKFNGAVNCRAMIAVLSGTQYSWINRSGSDIFVQFASNDFASNPCTRTFTGAAPTGEVGTVVVAWGGGEDITVFYNGALLTPTASSSAGDATNYRRSELRIVEYSDFAGGAGYEASALVLGKISNAAAAKWSRNIYGVFKEPRRINRSNAAPAGAPTLTDLQAVSITSSSAQATVDYAF
jgi:hypothetical protein